MNSMARSLVQRALHRREVRHGLQRPTAAATVGNKNNKQAAAAYSTAERLAAYRDYRSNGGYLLMPALVAVGAGIGLIATGVTRYLMTPSTTITTKVVEGPNPEVAAASPSN